MDQIWFIRIVYPDICNNLFNIVMRKDFAPLQYNGAFDVSKLGVVPFSQWYLMPTRIRGAAKRPLPYSTAVENAPCRGTAHVREDLKTLPRYELMKIA
jgi:hypothetical protein